MTAEPAHPDLLRGAILNLAELGLVEVSSDTMIRDLAGSYRRAAGHWRCTTWANYGEAAK